MTRTHIATIQMDPIIALAIMAITATDSIALVIISKFRPINLASNFGKND